MTASTHGVRGARLAVWALAFAALAGSAAAQAYKAPRNAFGHPDFSGTWTNASVTQLERPAQFKSLVITPAQAATLEPVSYTHLTLPTNREV